VLTSLLGIRLIVWMGSTVPTPPPASVLGSLNRIQVTNDADSGDGFQLMFGVAKGTALEYDLLQSSVVQPLTRVWIGVVVGVIPEVLIDGIVTHHQVAPSNEPGMTTITVTGTDLTVMLDLEERNAQYKNQPDSFIVTRLVLGYPQFGLVPRITPTTDVPIELQRVIRQHDTDLRFIRRLADKNGFVFYIEPVTFGVNTAFWGPVVRAGVPQPALTVDMGASTNVTDLSFSSDALAPVGASGSFVEPITKLTIPIPPLPPMRLPPLAASAVPASRTTLLRQAANQDPVQALLSSAAAATRAPEPVQGSGTLDAVRYGAVLRARQPVGLRGAGLSYDGFYWVRRVSHEISQGRYTQSFTLSREGTGALLPVVRP
jgi:hypothetical protein